MSFKIRKTLKKNVKFLVDLKREDVVPEARPTKQRSRLAFPLSQ